VQSTVPPPETGSRLRFPFSLRYAANGWHVGPAVSGSPARQSARGKPPSHPPALRAPGIDLSTSRLLPTMRRRGPRLTPLPTMRRRGPRLTPLPTMRRRGPRVSMRFLDFFFRSIPSIHFCLRAVEMCAMGANLMYAERWGMRRGPPPQALAHGGTR